MRDIMIVGAGGLGREVVWLIRRINEKNDTKWNILGFVDDGVEAGTQVQGFTVLGDTDYLQSYEKNVHVVCAIAKSTIKRKVIEKLQTNTNISFPNLIDPSVICADSAIFGIGSIVCANSVVSVNVQINDFVLIDWNCTVGHEAILESYTTLYPGVRVSGDTVIGKETEIGTGSCIIQGKTIGQNAVIGAGAVVVRDIPENCTAVGNPAKVIKTGSAI